MTILCDDMERVLNLGEKIYWAVFFEPKYKLEISHQIYGRESKAIYPEILKLEKKGWIKKVPMPENVEIGGAGKRANRRQYYSANIQPLLNNIIESLNVHGITINKNEKEKLKKFLTTEEFRDLIYYNPDVSKNNKKIHDFNIVRELLSYTFVFLTFKNHYLSKKNYPPDTIDNLLFENPRYETWVYNVMVHRLGIGLIEKLAKLNSYTSKILWGYFEDVSEFICSLDDEYI